MAEDVVGVIEIGENVALTEAAVESLDDLVSQPTEGVDGGGQPFVDEVLARHMRAELDDQDLGAQFDQSFEGVGPSAGETQGTLRGADVGDEVGRHRRTGVERAGFGEPHRDGVVGLRRGPEQLNPRGFGQDQVVVERLGRIDLERVEQRTDTGELHLVEDRLVALSLAIAGVAGRQVAVRDDARRRIAALRVVADPLGEAGVVADVAVRVADRRNRSVGERAQFGDHSLGHLPAASAIDENDPLVGLDRQGVALRGQDPYAVGDQHAGRPLGC